MNKSVCLYVSLSVVFYARSHLWADPDETLQNDPGGCLTDMQGSDVEPSPWGGDNFRKAAAEVATVKLFCALCHRKENNYVYTFAAGCMEQF